MSTCPPLYTLKASLSKKQGRLYLALSHRHSQPGYHWALILARKDIPTARCTEADAKCWDITNLNSAHEWQFLDALLSQYTALSLIARALLRKLDPSRRPENICHIHALLETLEIPQGDASFTCRVWALNGVNGLQKSGLININIPFERDAL
ncbi:hypothetical protein FB451DRAFT_1561463 [Mycena latifolia]|nr:hypothetical protein FB451DRAFT_1561463 [Mycena latifolia]